MKPFNLEEAKAGKPVCTRDGRPARIVEFDMKDEKFPIVAITVGRDKEEVGTFTLQGTYFTDIENSRDLMMVAAREEGWINVYKTDSGFIAGKIFSSKEEALESIGKITPYIDVVKIKFEPE